MNRRTKKCGNCTVCRETANTEMWKETEKKKNREQEKKQT